MKMNLKSGSGRTVMRGCCTKRKPAPDTAMSQDGIQKNLHVYDNRK